MQFTNGNLLQKQHCHYTKIPEFGNDAGEGESDGEGNGGGNDDYQDSEGEVLVVIRRNIEVWRHLTWLYKFQNEDC